MGVANVEITELRTGGPALPSAGRIGNCLLPFCSAARQVISGGSWKSALPAEQPAIVKRITQEAKVCLDQGGFDLLSFSLTQFVIGTTQATASQPTSRTSLSNRKHPASCGQADVPPKW